MDNDFKDDIIDLTGSMTCALQCTLSNVVIDLVTTDESFYDSSVDADLSQSPVKLKSCKRKDNSQVSHLKLNDVCVVFQLYDCLKRNYIS